MILASSHVISADTGVLHVFNQQAFLPYFKNKGTRMKSLKTMCKKKKKKKNNTTAKIDPV